MKTLLFLVNNWQDILVIVLLVIIVVAIINKWITINGPIFKKITTEEKMAYTKRLLQNLLPIALVLVINSEITYGSGTGQLKRSYVISELYKHIPDEYKKYITEDNLDAIINKTLDEAEQIWTDNKQVKRLVYGQDFSRNNLTL